MQRWEYLIGDTNNVSHTDFVLTAVSTSRDLLEVDDELKGMLEKDVTLSIPALGAKGGN